MPSLRGRIGLCDVLQVEGTIAPRGPARSGGVVHAGGGVRRRHVAVHKGAGAAAQVGADDLDQLPHRLVARVSVVEEDQLIDT